MRTRAEEGFSLVEALISTMLLMLLVSGLVGVLRPGYAMFLVQPERQDLQQRLRVASDALSRSLTAAGAGSALGPAAGSLLHQVPPVVPYRWGERHSDPAVGIFHRPDVVTLIAVPAGAPVATVDAYSASGTSASIDTGSCLTADGTCRFAVDMRILLADASGRASFATITSVASDVLTVDGRDLDPGIDPATATVAQVDAVTYAHRAASAAAPPRLTREGPAGVGQPVVDDVVRVEFAYEGDGSPPALVSTAPLETTYGAAPPPIGVDDPRDTWPAGENCLFIVSGGVHVPRLPALGAGGLVPLPPAMLTDGPWCPDAGSSGRFDADLLRVRTVDVVLRLQVGPSIMRGAAGPLFAVGGQGRDPARLVADQEVRLRIAPPNLQVTR